MIKFNEAEHVEIEKFNNGEGVFIADRYIDNNIKIMRVTLKKGSSIGLHSHNTNLEVIYVLEGKAVSTVEGVSEVVSKGEAIYMPNKGSHTIKNEFDSDLVMFCVIPEINK